MKNVLTQETIEKVKSIIKLLPKEIDGRKPYELMIYVETEDGYDLADFEYFDGINKLEKVVQSIIKNYEEAALHSIDFKFSEEEGEFDQFTIYTHKN